MTLQKQSVPINFAQGLDTKTDPNQVAIGKFLTLNNSVFGKGGLLQKRNGYEQLATDPGSLCLNKFNENLVSIGSTVNAYSPNSGTQLVSKGFYQAMNLSVSPLVRTSTTQSIVDSAISPNGLILTAYTDNVPMSGIVTQVYKYTVANVATGQNIVPITTITSGGGALTNQPRVFVLGNYFIVAYSVGTSIRYFALSSLNPAAATVEHTFTSQFLANGHTLAFDGVVANNSLYLAWNATDGGNAIRMNYLDSTLTLHTVRIFAGQKGTLFSVSADNTTPTPVIYVNYYDSATSNAYVFAVSSMLNPVLAQTQTVFTSAQPIEQMASVAKNTVNTVIFQIRGRYDYDVNVRTDQLQYNTITQAGVVGTQTSMARGVGLASKAFILNGTIYALAVYSSMFQSTYFLLDLSGHVISKLAYANGAGYYIQVLPSVTVIGSVASIPYLFQDNVQAVSKANDATNTTGIYTQTGVNLANFNFSPDRIVTNEIGKNLNITGGILWAYDGTNLTEQGFNLYPDNVEAATIVIATTGDTTSGSATLTALTSTTGIVPGMTITGSGIPASTTVLQVLSSSSILISANATATAATVTFTFGGAIANQEYFYQVLYEWTDAQGNIFRSAPSIPVSVTASTTTNVVHIPTLRLTYKPALTVKIQVYRWSVAQQVYYQVTTVQDPLLSDPTINSVNFYDFYSDAQILGNNILYTTGGVLENIASPAVSSMTLWQSRLFVIDSEDPNQLFFSKQVLSSTPVEMSDLLSIYVAPTTGAQGSTGPNKALAPLDDKLIIFKQDAIYYINGVGPDNTGANNQFSEPTIITATVGCANQNSIAQIPMGLIFESDKGIWLLGRDLGTQYIGAPVEKYTQAASVLTATSVPGTNQVRFSLSSGVTLMYDYYFGQWGTFSNTGAISSVVYQGVQAYIDSLGRIYQETPGLYVDGSTPVLMNFTSSWVNIAGLQGFERAYYLYLLATYLTPHKLAVAIGYDYNDGPTQSTMISPDNYSSPWGGGTLWGSRPGWGGVSNVEQWRIFLQKQKCQAFQVSIQEIFDGSLTSTPGAGFTMSGLDLVIGTKKGYPTLRPSRSVG